MICIILCGVCITVPALDDVTTTMPTIQTEQDSCIIQDANSISPIPLDYIEGVFTEAVNPITPTAYDMLDIYTPNTFTPITTYQYSKWTLDMPLSVELQQHTYNMAIKHQVPFEIIMGLMGVEAGWNANIGTKTNGTATYVGLGMMRDIYHVDRFKKMDIDIYTPEGNIEAICILIREKLEYYNGNITFALISYNRGIGGANAAIKAGIYTTGYDQKIMKYVHSFTYALT